MFNYAQLPCKDDKCTAVLWMTALEPNARMVPPHTYKHLCAMRSPAKDTLLLFNSTL